MSSDFDFLRKIVSRIFENRARLDVHVEHLKREAIEIERYYDPREEFNRWRDSSEGKGWKSEQYRRQKGCCLLCSNSIEVKGAHIDHIKPISKFPELNLTLSNLQVTCAPCNLRKRDS